MKKNNLMMAGVALLVLILVIVFGQISKTSKTATSNQNSNRVSLAPEFNYELVMKPTTLESTAVAYSFEPKEFTAGLSQTIKVKLTNQDIVGHSFKFNSLDFNSGLVEPGTSKIVTFTTPSKAGRYDFVCDQSDHKTKGMTGTMIVQ